MFTLDTFTAICSGASVFASLYIIKTMKTRIDNLEKHLSELGTVNTHYKDLIATIQANKHEEIERAQSEIIDQFIDEHKDAIESQVRKEIKRQKELG